MTTLEHIAGLDQFFVQQTFAPLVNRYEVSTLGPDNTAGQPLAFVQQKRMKISEEVMFFADRDRQQPLLRLKSKKILEARGRAEVQLPDGTVIGQLQKIFGKSLFRSSWTLLDANGNEVATAQESSLPIALLRRFKGLIPIVGDLPIPIPFHFDIAINGHTIGTYRRIWAIRDRYVMDLSADPERRLDRRVAMGFAVALDALQDR